MQDNLSTGSRGNTQPELLAQAATHAREGASDEEVKLIVGLSDEEMESLRPALKQERATRRAELRRAQTELALEGSEPLLRALGDGELAGAKGEATPLGLPDFERWPERGFGPGDPRLVAMENNERAMAEQAGRFCRMFRGWMGNNPGRSWEEGLRAIEEAGLQCPS